MRQTSNQPVNHSNATNAVSCDISLHGVVNEHGWFTFVSQELLSNCLGGLNETLVGKK